MGKIYEAGGGAGSGEIMGKIYEAGGDGARWREIMGRETLDEAGGDAGRG
jgi:hypothetical protein